MRKIIIVENIPAVRVMIMRALSGLECYELKFFRDAISSYMYIMKHKSEVHAIVSDFTAYSLGQFKLAEKLSEDSDTANIPVVVMCHPGWPDIVIQATELGAKDVVYKPIIGSKLKDAVLRLIPASDLADSYSKVE